MCNRVTCLSVLLPNHPNPVIVLIGGILCIPICKVFLPTPLLGLSYHYNSVELVETVPRLCLRFLGFVYAGWIFRLLLSFLNFGRLRLTQNGSGCADAREGVDFEAASGECERDGVM